MKNMYDSTNYMLEKKNQILFTWTRFGNDQTSGVSQGCQQSPASLSHYLHALGLHRLTSAGD